MTTTLSLRARLLGPLTQALLQPTLRLPPARMRPRLEFIAGLIARVPRGVAIERATFGGVAVDWLSPKGADPQRVVLYLHGGAYVGGSPRSHRGLLAQLAKHCGCRVAAIDYRLAPEYPFPAALDDALAAYRALLAQGLVPSRIVIAGDSAGGGLTLATTLALRDAGTPLPAALVLLSPWTDLTLSGDSQRTRAQRERLLDGAAIANAARAYAGARALTEPLLSPLYAELRGLPPLLIHVGDDEILLDDSIRFAAAAQQAGVPVTMTQWPGLWHVWQVLAGWLPEADASLRQIAVFIAQHTGGH